MLGLGALDEVVVGGEATESLLATVVVLDMTSFRGVLRTELDWPELRLISGRFCWQTGELCRRVSTARKEASSCQTQGMEDEMKLGKKTTFHHVV